MPRAVLREVGRLPALSRIGLVLMVVALIGDAVIRLVPVAHEHAAHRPGEHLAHFVALGAMALVLAGVLIDAARRNRSRRRNSHAAR